MCESNYGCWGNGQCNKMLDNEKHCFDGGDCNYKFGKQSKCNSEGNNLRNEKNILSLLCT